MLTPSTPYKYRIFGIGISTYRTYAFAHLKIPC